MTARLRELAERLDVLAHAVTEAQWSEFSMRVPVEPKRDADCVLSQAAIELRSYAKILDAEGDGGAVAIARLFKRREGVSKNAAPEFAARTMAEWDAPEGNEYWEYVQDLYTHPARSGVVSDADVEDAAVAYSKRATDGSQDVNFHDCIRAALTHFAKGAEVGVDAEDAARWRFFCDNIGGGYGDGYTEPREQYASLEWQQGPWIYDGSNDGRGRADTFPGWSAIIDRMMEEEKLALKELDEPIDAVRKGERHER